ncbi:MAG TPA: hypothetical protein VF097_05195 [Actinomycetota bacterium]
MRELLVVPLVLAALLVAAAPVGAEQPLSFERFEFEAGPFPDPFILEVCGLEVLTSSQAKGTITLFTDGTLKEHVNLVITSTNPDNGVTTTERDAFTFFSEPFEAVIDEEAGTITRVFREAFVGLPFRQMLPGGGVLIRDAGKVVLLVTIVEDLRTGEELSVEVEELEVRGPHPAGPLDLEERYRPLCDALAGEGR